MNGRSHHFSNLYGLNELQKLESGVDEKNAYFQRFLQYENIQEINRALLVELIDRIFVFENKEITIRFKLEDELQFIMD